MKLEKSYIFLQEIKYFLSINNSMSLHHGIIRFVSGMVSYMIFLKIAHFKKGQRKTAVTTEIGTTHTAYYEIDEVTCINIDLI